jgi:hypothetical protein
MQIQIAREDRSLERVVFPIPEICEYLTEETKAHLYQTIRPDEEGSKVPAFCDKMEDMYTEMECQKDLKGELRGIP